MLALPESVVESTTGWSIDWSKFYIVHIATYEATNAIRNLQLWHIAQNWVRWLCQVIRKLRGVWYCYWNCFGGALRWIHGGYPGGSCRGFPVELIWKFQMVVLKNNDITPRESSVGTPRQIPSETFSGIPGRKSAAVCSWTCKEIPGENSEDVLQKFLLQLINLRWYS